MNPSLNRELPKFKLELELAKFGSVKNPLRNVLESMNASQVIAAAQAYPRSPQERLISKREGAKLLAVSTRTLDRISEKGVLEKVHVNGSVRFRLGDINRIIQNGA